MVDIRGEGRHPHRRKTFSKFSAMLISLCTMPIELIFENFCQIVRPSLARSSASSSSLPWAFSVAPRSTQLDAALIVGAPVAILRCLMRTAIHTHTHTRMHIDTHARTHARTHIYLDIMGQCICVYVGNIFIHTHHTHTRTHSLSLSHTHTHVLGSHEAVHLCTYDASVYV